MAGVPQVKLEQLINGSWVDMSSRVLWGGSGGPVQITRGLAEGGGALIGTGSFVLDNSDGALTPKRTASPYYPYLTRYRRVRVTAYINGAWRPRHYGFVTDEPLTFGDETGQTCLATWSTIDHFGMAALKPLRSVAVESLSARGPLGYWPLTDAETPTLADQSPYSRAGLDRQQRGAGGEVGFGSGTSLATDGSGGLTLTPASDNGAYFQTDEGIDLPASWSLSVWVAPAAKDGYVCQVGTDSYSLGIWYDTSTKKFSAIETLLDSGGDPVDYVLSTGTAWPGTGIETMTVTATTVKLGSSTTTGTRHNSDQMYSSLVSVGGAMAVESGRARQYSGEVKHLAIWSGAYPSAASTDILTGPSAMFTLSTAVATVLAWAGLGTVTVSTSGTDRPVVLLQTAGMSAFDVIDAYGRGSLASIFCAGNGTVKVVAFDAIPTTVTAAGGLLNPGVEWVANLADDVTDVNMSWPDGTVYTATEAADYRSLLDLPGVLAGDTGRAVADWALVAADGSPAFRNATYDLLTVPDADLGPLALVEAANLLTVPGLPVQLPSTTQSALVEQITETIGADLWDSQVTLGADDRARMFIVGDATRGVVGAGYLAGPLSGSPTSGQWRAGHQVSAANLNSRQFAGGQMQCGVATVTPVAGVDTFVGVTFPVAFSAMPTVCAFAATDVPFSEVKSVTVSNVTMFTFRIYVNRTNTTVTSLRWIAAV